jgi:hypothetical protein
MVCASRGGLLVALVAIMTSATSGTFLTQLELFNFEYKR